MNNKKAFTVVELVIVIAIIAILAAVLIPTFASMVRSANVSADTQLIKNLNTSLRADLPDGKHPTMHDALKAAEAFGYDVDKINASAVGNEILWDQRNDVFCYVKGEEVIYIPESVQPSDRISDVDSCELWKIYNAKSGAVPVAGDQTNPQTNSIYLGPDANYSSALDNDVFNVTVGIDVGNQPAISSIKYENNTNDGKTVVIRTNGGTLTVNAPNDTVSHYGFATVVNVNDVDDNCYNENGTVGRLIYSDNDGKIYFGDTAVVYCYMNTSTDTAANAEFPGVKAANAIVYTYVDSGEDEAKGYAAADNKKDVTVNDGIVEISTCFNHNEDYDIIYIGDDIYIICKCCGAFSRISTDANGTTTVESSEGIGTENQEHETNEFIAKNNSSLPIINAVATIGYTKYYSTLAAAVIDAKDGDTITMLKNHTTAAQTFSKTLTLDLNGKAVSGTGVLLTFNGTGSFTVKDSSINGSITGAQVAVKNSGTGTVVIDGGSLIVPDNKQHYGIYNTAAGTIIVNKGLVSGQFGIYNSAPDGTIRVNGGEIRGGSKSGIFCYYGRGDVIITGGTVTSTSEYGISFSTNSSYNSNGQGSLTVSGNASISGTYGIFSGNPSIITLSGNTTVTGSGNYGIYLYNTTTTPASVTINDSAKISGNSKYGVYVYTTKAVNTLNINNNAEIKGLTHGVYDYNGVVNINGGTISGGTYGVVNTGTLTIEDGTIQANLYYGVFNSGTLNMNGGTIIGGIHESAGRGIYNTGTAIINGGAVQMNVQTPNSQVAIDNRKNITINDCTITSDTIGVYSTDSFTFAGGIITAANQGIQNFGTVTMSGGEIHCDNGTGINNAKGLLTVSDGNISAQIGIYVQEVKEVQGPSSIIINGEKVHINAIKCIWLDSANSSCNISAGEFKGTNEVCYAQNGFFKISGGTFTGTGSTNVEDHIYRYTLNCLDSSYRADPATAGFTVTGGSFYQFNPENDLSEGPNTCFTPEGYHAEYNESTGYYTVVENN